MRFIYIRCNGLLTIFGEMFTMVLIVVSSQSTIILMTAMYVYNNQRTWKMDQCFEPLENLKVFDLDLRFGIAFLGFITILELMLNMNISYFIYQKDKHVKSLLNPKRYKKRNVKNAIDFTGHLIHFLFENLTFLIFSILGEASGPKSEEKSVVAEIFALCLQSSGVLLPVIMIGMSEPLKEELSDLISSTRHAVHAIFHFGNNHTNKSDKENQKSVVNSDGHSKESDSGTKYETCAGKMTSRPSVEELPFDQKSLDTGCDLALENGAPVSGGGASVAYDSVCAHPYSRG